MACSIKLATFGAGVKDRERSAGRGGETIAPAPKRRRHDELPKQLRHVSFLARRRQRTLAERHRLSAEEAEAFDYRSKSLLDLASEAVARKDRRAYANRPGGCVEFRLCS